MALEDEIVTASKEVSADHYTMSVAELISMYKEGEIVVDPDFQRLFRWSIVQKSRFIESLLIGIPIPPIFVFSTGDKWELVDGLQRLSTILEFRGILRQPGSDELLPPSRLVAGEYLPSLEGVGWQAWDDTYRPMTVEQQFKIRRVRIGVEILRERSDPKAKFDLFMRLNSGGSPLSRAELRNCILSMTNPHLYNLIFEDMAINDNFLNFVGLKRALGDHYAAADMICRLLVLSMTTLDWRKSVADIIDDGIKELGSLGIEELNGIKERFDKTCAILSLIGEEEVEIAGRNIKIAGKFGRFAFDTIAVGVFSNAFEISLHGNFGDFVKKRLSAKIINKENNEALTIGELYAPIYTATDSFNDKLADFGISEGIQNIIDKKVRAIEFFVDLGKLIFRP